MERAHYVLTGKKVPILKIHRKSELFRAVEKHIINLEATQSSQDFTISVVCNLRGQRDEDAMLGNGFFPFKLFSFFFFHQKQTGQQTCCLPLKKDLIPEEFEDFMEDLATRVELKGFKKYAGGLDTSGENLNGMRSYYSEFCGNNIMFHVAPLLPRRVCLFMFPPFNLF